MEKEHAAILARKKDKLLKEAAAAATPAKGEKGEKRKGVPVHIGQQPPPYKKGGGAVMWLGAKLLPSDSKMGYRVWYDPSVPAQEKIFKYNENQKAAWATACKAIKDHYQKPK